jgi:predicted transcriptional regulator
MANAAYKVREVFKKENKPLTAFQITQATNLKPNEVSMALCYLKKQRYVSRKLIPHEGMGRKNVFLYTYSAEKLPV